MSSDMESPVRVAVKLRCLQTKINCSSTALKSILGDMLAHRNPSSILRKADKHLSATSGAECLRLHGCIGCDEHVFASADRALNCPRCGHPRYNGTNQPNEATLIAMHVLYYVLICFNMFLFMFLICCNMFV